MRTDLHNGREQILELLESARNRHWHSSQIR
jgi:hypothetical protein